MTESSSRVVRRTVSALMLAVVGSTCAWSGWAPNLLLAAPQGSEPPTATVPITPGDLERIRKALDSSSPAIKIDDDQLRYYVQILAKQKSFADYVKGYDLMNGATKGGNPMTHREFLNLVTPREFYSSGGITAWEQLQFALTNYLGQTFVRKAIEDLQRAKDGREVDEIRDRIERELSALRRRPAAEPVEPRPSTEPTTPAPSPGPAR